MPELTNTFIYINNQLVFLSPVKSYQGIYGHREKADVTLSRINLCFSFYLNKQHFYDIFISFKHNTYNKCKEVQGIPILSSKLKGIINALLRATTLH